MPQWVFPTKWFSYLPTATGSECGHVALTVVVLCTSGASLRGRFFLADGPGGLEFVAQRLHPQVDPVLHLVQLVKVDGPGGVGAFWYW